ncbi:glycosyltransferase [Microbacterium sp. KUDC0406]|uniref:glycosyltransferase n=1 Tax=Microbacterium sp. KUDC0406 TaxID=2909588 RepID=UPI001F31F248|nr:glycosyltransferase [Microbacterium sp. KUDC0406]UJP08883.1 glycosyltransferase [Microbacterium sp. KUDC0406]
MPVPGRQLLRAALRNYSTRADLRWRKIPSFEVLPATSERAVYYLTPHSDGPHGGIRVAFRHVDLLNAIGIRSAVLYPKGTRRPAWFESSTPMVTADTVEFHADDILVVPEVYGPMLTALRDDIRVLIFNQGAYITFNHVDLTTSHPGAPYSTLSRFEGIMTVSEDSAELLGLAFPEAQIDIARPVVDSSIFYADERPRSKTIAYVPTRRADELHQVLHILRARGTTWELRALQGLTEKAVGEALRSTSIFLSLSERDGFGLPPAEAMACGNYVVGYHGGGGREFFDPAFSRTTTSTIDLISALEQAMSAPLDLLARKGRAASDSVLNAYSEDGLRDDLARIYSRLI